MIIYTCPRCGADLYTYVVTTFPPITINSCSKCGWRYEDKCAATDDIIRVPFPEVDNEPDS